MREYPTCRKGSDGCCLANRRVQEQRLNNKAKADQCPGEDQAQHPGAAVLVEQNTHKAQDKAQRRRQK